MKKKRFLSTVATGWLLVVTLVLTDIDIVFAKTKQSAETEQEETVDLEQEIEERELRETDAEVTEISSVEEFLAFVKGCQMDAYSYGRIFSLKKDLDISGEEFTGIPYFEGTFLGNGHTISGMDISMKGSDYGFFRYIGIRGVVKELHIDGKIRLEGSAANVGGFVGVNKGIVAKCSFEGTVTGIDSAGGLAGCNKENGVLLDCSVKGTVTATNITGGVCGQNDGIIKNCTSEAFVNVEDLRPTLDLDGIDLGTLNLTQNVVTRNDMGGIAGVSKGTVADCTNTGTIGFVHTGYNVGGIVGRHSGTMMNCTNKGNVYGRKDVGGIVGQAEPYMESQYLSDRLEKIREDFNRINNLVVQMSNAMSETSGSTKQYTQTLQKQYEDTIASLNSQVNALQGTIAANNEQTKEYLDSLTKSLENMGNLGNDTVNKMVDSIGSELDNLKNELDSKIPESSSSEKPSIPELPSVPELPSIPESSSSSEPESSSAQESSSSQESSSNSGTTNTNGVSTTSEGEAAEPEGTENIGEVGSIDTGHFRKLSAVTEVHSSLQTVDPEIQGNLDRMNNEMISATGDIKKMQSILSNSTNSVGETAGNIADELERNSKESGKSVNGLTNSVDAGIQKMTSSLNGIMSTTDEISDYVGEDINILLGNGSAISDISSVDLSVNMLGVISDCVNYGIVEADINTGGIIGTMNVEYDIDPELDFDLTTLTDVTVRATVNDVVLHCKNYGTIKIKKNNCGGIVGNSEMGIIFDCENYGGLQSDNGKRMGGIAGMSSSNIESSYAFCNIEGKDYLGGICGEGYDIHNCISLSTIIREEGECVGGIAGTTDSEATVSGNYFSNSELGGIDNINYAGKAEPCTYETIMEMSGIPKGFQTVTVTFELGDEILQTIQIPYGSTLTGEQFPSVEDKEESYFCWEKASPIENVTENITLQAEEKRWILSVASDKKTEQQKSYALAEGRFYEDTTMILTACNRAESVKTEQPAYAYSWEIENAPDRETEYRVHLLIPEEYDSAQVFIEEEKGWRQVETERDGSYLIVRIPYATAFAVYGTVESNMLYYIAAGVAAAIVVLLILYRTQKNRKKEKNGLVKK